MKDPTAIFEKAKEHFYAGLAHIGREEWTAAERELDASLKYVPDRVSTLTNLCAVLIRLKKFDKASETIERGLRLDAANPELILNSGLLDLAGERFIEALSKFEKSLALKPDYAEAWGNRGNALSRLKRLDDALASYERAIELKRDYLEAWIHRGVLLSDLQRHEEALASYERSIELRPDHAEIWTNHGHTLQNLGRHEEALVSYQRAITLKPDDARAWSDRGVALNELKRNEEALVSHERGIEINPGYAEAWSNRGNALQGLDRYEEAVASYQNAVGLKADYADAWLNRGNALKALKRYGEALASYERALALKPADAEAHYNRGILQLLLKNFHGGFEDYLWRWRNKDWKSKPLATSLPRCSPQGRNGHALLWAEQGLGDEILYASMLQQAQALCTKITLSADRRLHSIFRRSFPGIDLIDRNSTGAGISEKHFDTQAPIGDLGYLLARDSGSLLHSGRPFLLADPVKKSEFKQRPPFNSGKLTCGISWKSGNKKFGDAKSATLAEFGSILKDPRLSFVNLQYGSVDTEIQSTKTQLGAPVHQMEGLDVFNDIDGLLSLIDACDFVITTSSVAAHLAGSIGKKGCLLVPFSRGRIWYWHENDAHSFWYPSLKLFYQEQPGDWTDPINQMVDWVRKNYL
jgi:tetratricopeptide (TPR) repeat protein